MAQHTPGPWEIAARHNEDELVAANGNAVAYAAWDGGSGCHLEIRNKADAALICAAPDLLAVLEAVMPYLEQGYMEDEDDNEPIGWCSDPDGTNQRPLALTFGMVRQARAALAKARVA